MTSVFVRNCRNFAASLLGAAVLVTSVPASAQVPASQPVRQTQDEVAQAETVRDGLMRVLEQYPPQVAAVLKLDPSLLSSEAYIAGYKSLQAYLKEHPEILRSPAFYFQQVQPPNDGQRSYYDDPRERAWRDLTETVQIIAVTVTVFLGFAWLFRTAIDYRRWGRLARVQAEAHTKLLDRFAGNDELLAYVQSPAGARFLQSSPIALDGSAKPVGAPINRILWSIQAGVVLAAAGLGLYYVSRNIDGYRAEPVFMFAILLLAVGLGFAASAALSYLLSRRLGLLETPRTSASE
jgi:hypothetical protein